MIARLMGNVRDAGQAQRDKKRQRGLGAVRRGAQGVQTEDWNAGDGTNLLGALFRGRQRLAHQEVETQHA
jgi:hypothetical protein